MVNAILNLIILIGLISLAASFYLDGEVVAGTMALCTAFLKSSFDRLVDEIEEKRIKLKGRI